MKDNKNYVISREKGMYRMYIDANTIYECPTQNPKAEKGDKPTAEYNHGIYKRKGEMSSSFIYVVVYKIRLHVHASCTVFRQS
jgi:hypothetical protein